MRSTFASCRKFMTYCFHIKQPMPAVEMKLNMISAKIPYLIFSPNRFHNHPLFRKSSHIPFKI